MGAFAGLLARHIVPNPGPGRFVVGVLGGAGATGFDAWPVFVVALGAAVLLCVCGPVARRTA